MSNLETFDRIDQLVKAGKIVDLEQALDLEHCNIMEVYYNHGSSRGRDANRKSYAFNSVNGVLLYKENRLITRYRYALGEVNRLFKGKLKAVQQSLVMFGFIEIDAEFATNIFKTVKNILFRVLLETICYKKSITD